MYVDLTYYKEGYLLGRAQAVLDQEFAFWEKQARTEIDAYTFGRLEADNSLITDKVKDCTCAIAELLHKAHTLSESNMAQGIAGPLASWSNDGNSGSIDVSQSIYTESGKKAEIRRLIYLYLGNTGLLYAGVGC